MNDATLTFYGDSRSGNCYKLKLLCSELGFGYDWREVDILAGTTHSDEFLAMNPNGKIPVMLLPDGQSLAESNAILCYLGERDYIAGAAFTIADIALFAYTHVADEGGFSLADYPAVTAWLDRIRARPNFVPM